ncbi:MAG: hypothetical protein ABJQ71_11525 [Roseibium sp.]
MTTQAEVKGPSERQQVKQRFLLHSVDALLGRRLPDRKELLMGMPFFKGALEEDVLRFCSKTLKRISDQVKPDSEIVGLLTRITYLNIPKLSILWITAWNALNTKKSREWMRSKTELNIICLPMEMNVRRDLS